MGADTVEIRKEAKAERSQPGAGTLVDSYLSWMGRGRPVSAWKGIVVTSLLSVVLSLIILVLSGELSSTYQSVQRFFPGVWAGWLILSLCTSSASMILGNVFFHRAAALVLDQVAGLAESERTLRLIKTWVALAANRWLAVAMLLVGFAWTLYAYASLPRILGLSLGVGTMISISVFAMQSFLFLGYIVAALVLAVRTGEFELRLFAPDPASSEVIARLSGLFSELVFLMAAYATLLTLAIAAAGVATLHLPALIFFWALITAIFAVSQYSLSQVIQRAKWKTLNGVQQRIEDLQKQLPLSQKEDREALLWLLDYHDRVKAARGSALDIRSGLSFLNSMLLPVFGFILGNVESFLRLFAARP